MKEFKFDFSFYYQEPEYKQAKKKSSKHDDLITQVQETLSFCLGEELLHAVQQGNITRVRSLLERKASLKIKNEAGWTVLTWAAVNGLTDIARVLLDHGADVKMLDNAGWPPHIWAAVYGHASVQKVLLDYGADINFCDKDGWSPLLYAARYGHVDAGKGLLDSGAKLNYEDYYGWTALMRACFYEHPEFVRMLLERGADPNRKTHKPQTWLDVGTGWTALMIAAFKNKGSTIANMLVTSGARLDEENSESQTALDVALSESVKQIIKEAPSSARMPRPLTI